MPKVNGPPSLITTIHYKFYSSLLVLGPAWPAWPSPAPHRGIVLIVRSLAVAVGVRVGVRVARVLMLWILGTSWDDDWIVVIIFGLSFNMII